MIAALPLALDELVLTGPGPRRERSVPLQITRTVHVPSTQFEAVDVAVRCDGDVVAVCADPLEPPSAVVPVRADPLEPPSAIVPVRADPLEPPSAVVPVPAGTVVPRAGVVRIGSGTLTGLSAPQPSIAAATRVPRALAAGRIAARDEKP